MSVVCTYSGQISKEDNTWALFDERYQGESGNKAKNGIKKEKEKEIENEGRHTYKQTNREVILAVIEGN